MKHAIAALGLILISSEGSAAQTAISCSLNTVEEHEVFGSRTAPQTTEHHSVGIFVLDDERKSITRYDAISQSLQDMCIESSCNLVYGGAEIHYHCRTCVSNLRVI